jgi:hypothetical protein
MEENTCEREGDRWRRICERERERLVEGNMCEREADWWKKIYVREREIGGREYV